MSFSEQKIGENNARHQELLFNMTAQELKFLNLLIGQIDLQIFW